MWKSKKSIKTKNDEEVKKDFKKIVLHPFTGSGNNNALELIDTHLKLGAGYTVAQVPRVNGGNNGINLETKYLQFLYFRTLDDKNDLAPQIREYFNDLKQKFKVALGIPESLKNLWDIIEVIDRPQNAANNDWMPLVPRYKKLMKLKEVYEILIKFSLELIHKLYWVDFLKRNTLANGNYAGVEQTTNIHNINHYIERVIPISLQIKKLLEQEVENDFPTDIVDLQFTKGQKF